MNNGALDISLPLPLESEAQAQAQVIKRGRGRPKGSRNVSESLQHYEPKKWEPWMDELVIYSLIGKRTNEELAVHFSISVGHVSNILCTKQANERKEMYRQAVMESNPDISAQIVAIQKKAVKRVITFLDDDKQAEASPIAYVSQVKGILAMTFPKGETPAPPSATSNITNIQNNILVTNQEFHKRVADGLEGSLRVSELHEARRLELMKGNETSKEIKDGNQS